MLLSNYLTLPPGTDVSEMDEQKIFQSIVTSNGTRKTTEPGRLNPINALFFETLDRLSIVPRTVMDIGVSSGATTLDWMREFDHRKLPVSMIATDLVMNVYIYLLNKNVRALTESNGHLLQIEIFGKSVYTYSRRRDYYTGGLIWRRALCAMVRSRLGSCVRDGPYNLVTPPLRGQDRIVLLEDDIFAPTPRQLLGCADVIRAANLIQRGYFPDTAISRSIQTIRERCRGAGSLVIISRNRPERLDGTIFRLTETGRFVVEARLGAGSEVEQFFTSHS